MELDDRGFVGACEADQRSTITKLMMTYQVGHPGFISDPVIDTSKNRIIYAHCVALQKCTVRMAPIILSISGVIPKTAWVHPYGH